MAFFDGDIVGCTIFCTLDFELVEGVAFGIALIHAPNPESLKANKNVVERILTSWLRASLLQFLSHGKTLIIHLIICPEVATITAFHTSSFLVANPELVLCNQESAEALKVAV